MGKNTYDRMAFEEVSQVVETISHGRADYQAYFRHGKGLYDNVLNATPHLFGMGQTPRDSRAIAWMVLDACDQKAGGLKPLRQKLRTHFKEAVDVSQVVQAAEVLDEVTKVRKDFAHGTARALGEGLRGTSPRATGYWRMIEIFSDVCNRSGQSELAVDTLTQILVKHKFPEHYLGLLHIDKHGLTPTTTRMIYTAFSTRADQDENRGSQDTAEGWRIRARMMDLQLRVFKKQDAPAPTT